MQELIRIPRLALPFPHTALWNGVLALPLYWHFGRRGGGLSVELGGSGDSYSFISVGGGG